MNATINRKSKYERQILSKIKQLQKEFPNIENIKLRDSLLSGYVMKLMNDAETCEEVKEIYSKYQLIIYNRPI